MRSIALLVTTLFALLGGVVALSESARALTITTADGRGADTTIYKLQPNNNLAHAYSLVVKNDQPVFSHTRQIYIRMDLVSAPGPITDAVLILTAMQSSITFDPPVIFTFDLWGLNDGHASEEWVEGSGQQGVVGGTPPVPITWNNAPANDTSNGGVIASQTTLLGSFTISNSLADGEQIAISTPSLLSFLQSDTDDLVTFIMTRRHVTQPSPNVGHVFASKEHGTLSPPTLDLTVIPEPSTALLLAFGLMALAAGRRRY